MSKYTKEAIKILVILALIVVFIQLLLNWQQAK